MKPKNKKLNIKPLFDKKFLLPFFEKNLNKYFKKINSIYIDRIRYYNRSDFQKSVNFFHLDGIGASNRPYQMDLYGAAHSDGTRKQTYKNMSLLFSKTDKLPGLTATKPLFYSPLFKASFHQEFPGKDLEAIILTKPSLLKDALIKTAKWLALLHNTHPKTFGSLAVLDHSYLDPTTMINKLKKKDQQYKKRIAVLLKAIKKYWIKNLSNKKQMVPSHGDLHLQNVLISGKNKISNLAIIDYTDIGLAYREFDLGHFINRLYITITKDAEKKPVYADQMISLFLKHYTKKARHKLDFQSYEYLSFFDSITPLKWAIYFIYLGMPKKDIEYYIKYSENGLKKLKIT